MINEYETLKSETHKTDETKKTLNPLFRLQTKKKKPEYLTTNANADLTILFLFFQNCFILIIFILNLN